MPAPVRGGGLRGELRSGMMGCATRNRYDKSLKRHFVADDDSNVLARELGSPPPAVHVSRISGYVDP